MRSVFEVDSILFADRPANATPVAAPLIDNNLFVPHTVGKCSELTDPHALTAANAPFRLELSDMLRPVHARNVMIHGCFHGHAVGPVTVADASYKRCSECPDAVAEAFTFMLFKGHNGLFCA
jgi:hypothetical protein